MSEETPQEQVDANESAADTNEGQLERTLGLSPQRETGLVEVGREYFDSLGVILILAGGLLATISSANASIRGGQRLRRGHYR